MELQGQLLEVFGDIMHKESKWKRLRKHISRLDIFVFLSTSFTAFMVIDPFYHIQSRLLEIVVPFAIIIMANLYPILRKKEVRDILFEKK